MRAYSGHSWKKNVSNSPTIGVFGKTSRKLFTALMHASLCIGQMYSLCSFMAASTLSSRYWAPV